MARLLSRTHRSDLKRHGLSVAQIDALEILLPSAKAHLSILAPMKGIRDKLLEVTESAKATRKVLAGLKIDGLAELREANARLAVADHLLNGSDNDTLDAAVQALDRTVAIAENALAALPTKQKLTTAIPPQVMQLIDRGLLASSTIDGVATETPWISKVSTPESAYSEIVRICMTAMGREDPDPRTMIRAHQRWLIDQREFLRARMESRRSTS